MDARGALEDELKSVYKKIGKTPSQLNAGINALGFLIKDVRNSWDPVALNGLGNSMADVQKGMKETLTLLHSLKPNANPADEMKMEKRANAARATQQQH